MAKGHRTQIKRERNAEKDTRRAGRKLLTNLSSDAEAARSKEDNHGKIIKERAVCRQEPFEEDRRFERIGQQRGHQDLVPSFHYFSVFPWPHDRSA